VAELVALQRAEVIAELAARVAQSDSPEAAAAVRQLAAMPRAPLSILVSAVTSADRAVAEQAKLSISKLLRRAQRQIEAGHRESSVARQLAELAASLDAQQAKFSAADDAWVSSTTHKILRLANEVPPRHTPLVALQCDSILAKIASRQAVDLDIVKKVASGGQPADRVRAHDEMPVASAHGSRAQVHHSALPALTGVADPAATSSVEATAEISGEESLNVPWQDGWSHPMFRMMPAKPIQAPAAEEPTSPTTPSPVDEMPPVDLPAAGPPLAELDSRELLRRWIDAEGGDVFPLEDELTRRGFGRLSQRLVEQLFSTDSADRLALIDDVLTEPGIDARPWLMLLSEDSEADVRLLAVTIMATSNDAALVEKAWQVSIRDEDSRIAGLAGRLRERRAETR
jgi:hypothetical protein